MPEDAPDWYRDAVVYELHVRAFSDSSEDGIGDFKGLISKLDYLHDLGVTAIWLLPFYPSPLRDDGYDIADYRSVNPSYGTMRDVGAFIRKAHERGLRVITELVLNHTSDQHPWFQRARHSPAGSRWRNFYVWSDTPDRYRDARIIFSDFESSNCSWDPVAGAYYWHRFYSHQPDLNFESADVRRALFSQVDHWFRLGVDGLRLDAVPYLYEREGTICENLPETHGFLKDLRRHVDERFPNRMLLAEANQWPEDAAEYFGDGDECHMAFHFPLMPRLFMAIQMEDRFPIIDILQQTPEIPENCQWALFLRNHDELTLEMVTDEERDYMYRVYAHEREARINLGIRRRLAPLLGNDRRTIELLNAILFALPGTPVIYYGDELGMGDNVYLGDRDGVRTPMQWTADRNAGFSTANPQALYLPTIIDSGYHYERVNVEAQRTDPASLLAWMRQLIAVRRAHPVLGLGEISFLDPENHRVLAFLRTMEGEVPILVVANLARLAQAVELDLHEYLGRAPHEMFGGTDFAPIGELPYYLTLNPYAVFWFQLRDSGEHHPAGETPVLRSGWNESFSGRTPPVLAALQAWLPKRRWYAGKDRRISQLRLAGVEPLGDRQRGDLVLAMVNVTYTEGEPDTYAVPLARLTGDRARSVQTYRSEAVVAELPGGDIVVDAMADDESATRVVRSLLRRRSAGRLASERRPPLRAVLRTPDPDRRVRLVGVEQSNTSVVLGDDVMVKLLRRIDRGTNPDLEIGRHLEAQGFGHAAAVLGSTAWRRGRGEPDTIAIAYRFVPNEGDAWRHSLDHLSRFYDTVLTEPMPPPEPAPDLDMGALASLADRRPEHIGSFLDDMAILGQRTGQLHAALAAPDVDGFEPEPFTRLYQRSLYQAFRTSLRSTLAAVRRTRSRLSEECQLPATRVLDGHDRLEAGIAPLRDGSLDATRIRTHGDYHLGQVLVAASDFVIIDFEGEPARPISERRIKRSPLADVAGMLRSFDYAAHVGLDERADRGLLASTLDPVARAWAEWWRREVTRAFLAGYLRVPEARELLPSDSGNLGLLLDGYLLDKALYELRYELANRPSWVGIPLDALDRRVGRGV